MGATEMATTAVVCCDGGDMICAWPVHTTYDMQMFKICIVSMQM